MSKELSRDRVTERQSKERATSSIAELARTNPTMDDFEEFKKSVERQNMELERKLAEMKTEFDIRLQTKLAEITRQFAEQAEKDRRIIEGLSSKLDSNISDRDIRLELIEVEVVSLKEVVEDRLEDRTPLIQDALSQLTVESKELTDRVVRIEGCLFEDDTIDEQSVGQTRIKSRFSDFAERDVINSRKGRNEESKKRRSSMFSYDGKMRGEETSPQVPTNRRSSFGLALENQGSRNRNVTIMAQEYVVPEDKKLRSISGRSFIFLVREYANYQATALDKSKNMIDFFSTSAKEQLHSSELSLGTEISETLTLASINSVSNELLLNMVARFLRPRAQREYRKLVFNTVTELKAKSDKWEWGLKGYSEFMHPMVAVLLREQQDIEELVRRDIRAEQENNLPKVGWGNRENQGVFQVMLECFGKYKLYFKAAAQDLLKDKTKFSDYVKVMSDLNNNLAKKSNETLTLLASFEPRTFGRQEYEDTRSKSLQEGLVMGSKLKKPLSQQALDYKVRHTVASINDDMSAGQSVASTDDAEELDEDDGSDHAIVGHLSAMVQAKQAAKLTKEDKAKMPCFSFALTGRCSEGRDCMYSHDKSKCEEHMGKVATQVNASPFTTAAHRQLIARMSVPPSRSTFQHNKPPGDVRAH